MSVILLLAIIAIIATLATFVFVFSYMIDLMASQREHSQLMGLVIRLGRSTPLLPYDPDELTDEDYTGAIDESYVSAFDEGMREINPDYICWLKIDGTMIDYPVVRAADNEKYLNLSFAGEKNRFGALFMDYRCAGSHVPHIIIYGHNVKNGYMFGTLRNFLDKNFTAKNPVISLRVNDRLVEYEVFSARKTNLHDPAYYIDFREPGSFEAFLLRNGAPESARQILTLSTCVSGNDSDERVIVQAALR